MGTAWKNLREGAKCLTKKHTRGIKTIQDLCARRQCGKTRAYKNMQVQSLKNCQYRCKVWKTAYTGAKSEWTHILWKYTDDAACRPCLQCTCCISNSYFSSFIVSVSCDAATKLWQNQSPQKYIWYIYMKDKYRWCVPADIACSAQLHMLHEQSLKLVQLKSENMSFNLLNSNLCALVQLRF